MKPAWTAAVGMALCVVCAPAGAQSLVDAAKRAEDSRKASTATPLIFDERDVNPMLAARDVLVFEITEDRWKKLLAADQRMTAVLEKDPALWERLSVLRATTARTVERFITREPSLLKVIQTAGTDPHEYAYTAVAVAAAMAFISGDFGAAVLEQLPDATKANIAFVRARETEVKDMLSRSRQLQDKMGARGR